MRGMICSGRYEKGTLSMTDAEARRGNERNLQVTFYLGIIDLRADYLNINLQIRYLLDRMVTCTYRQLISKGSWPLNVVNR
jgi:hypothetical protein